MQSRPNTRFILALTAALAAAVGCLIAGHRAQTARQVEALPRLAEKASAAGNFGRAYRFLTYYLGYRPSDVEARIGLAQLLEQKAQTPRQKRQVIEMYEEVSRTDPNRVDARRKLAELNFGAGQYDEAIKNVDAILSQMPADFAALQLRGRCQATLGDFEGAVESFRRAIESPAATLDAYTGLASALLKLKRPAEADRVMSLMVERNPHLHTALLTRGGYLLDRAAVAAGGASGTDREHLMHAAKTDFAAAARLAPDNADVLFLSAGLALQSNDRQSARTHLKRGLTLFGNDLRFYAALADVELSDGRRAEAVAVLDRGFTEVGSQIELSLDFADLFQRVGEGGKSLAVLKKVRPRLSPVQAIRADVTEAHLDMKVGHWAAAYRLLERVRPLVAEASAKASRIDLDLAECARNLGAVGKRMEYARRATKAAPEDPAARAVLAAALADAGRIDEALATYRPLVESETVAKDVLFEYARLMIAQQEAAAAGSRRWDESEAAVRRVAARYPKDARATLLRADLFLARRQPAAAREVLTAARDSNPDRVEFWTALATLDALAGDRAAAERILGAAERRLGDRAEFRLARLRAVFDPTDRGAAAFLDRLADAADRYAIDDQLRLFLALAQANVRIQRLSTARNLAARILQASPTNLTARLFAFDLAAQARDVPAMTAAVEELKRVVGSAGQIGLYAEAALLTTMAEAGDTAVGVAARGLIEELIRSDPNSPRAFVLAGRLDEVQGRTEAAGGNYSIAVRNGDTRPEVLRRAVERLMAHKRYAEADDLIRSAERSRLSAILHRHAAEVSLRMADFSRAVDLAAQAVPADTANPADLLWQAWVSAASQKFGDAERLLRRAIELRGGAECRVALVRLLAGTGATARAEVDAEATETIAASPADQLTAAECWEVLGQHDRADKNYRIALGGAPDNPSVLLAVCDYYLRTDRFLDAEPLLRRLINRWPAAKPDEVAAARRMLAVGLSLSGDWLNCQTALGLIAANEAEFPADKSNAAARAAILTKTPGRRQEAIRWYEDQRRGNSGLPGAQILALADAYESTGDWLHARKPLLEYLGETGRTPPAQADAIERFLRHDDLGDAASWLRRLKTSEPKSLRTVTLDARIAMKQGRSEQAKALLRALTPGSDSDRVRLAMTWEAVGDFARAEALWKEYSLVGSDTGRRLSLVHFYGRAGSPLKALDTCERLLSDGLPPDAVVAVMLDALRGRKTDPTVYSRIETWVAGTGGHALRWRSYFLAEIREEQGKYDDAVLLAERFLRDNPDNIFGIIKRVRLILIYERDPETALRLVETAIGKYGPLVQLTDIRSAALLDSGREAQARALLEAAAADSASPLIRYRLARAYHATERTREAGEMLRQAIAVGLAERDLHPIERPGLKEFVATYSPPR